MLRRVVWIIFAEHSGTSVSFYQTTRRNIPEDSDLHLLKQFIQLAFCLLYLLIPSPPHLLYTFMRNLT
jgi:hypothetical protein